MQRTTSIRRPTSSRNAAEEGLSKLPGRSSDTRAIPKPTGSFKMPAKPVSKPSSGRASQSSVASSDTPIREASKSAIGRSSSIPQSRAPLERSNKRVQSPALTSPSTTSSKKAAPAYSTPQPRRTASITSEASSRGSRATSSAHPASPYPSSSARQLGHRSTRSVSSQTPTSTPLKPSTFSTHQQKSTPPASASVKRTPSTTTPSRHLQPQTPNNDLLRIQTHLLHLSLLHQASGKTLKALTASARSSLQARHAALQSSYAAILEIQRQVRQSRNILALHDWCGGNMVALTRKLTTLTSVLGDACLLAEPEVGRYAIVVSQFESWVAWIEEVWKARDEEEARMAGGSVVRDDLQLENHTPGEESDMTSTAITGLGDAMKTEIKHLQTIVNGLVLRMDELVRPGGVGSPRKTAAQSEEAVDTNADTTSAPAVLIAHAHQFVLGMQEELQMMREVDFEVEAGEKAWRDERSRRLRDAAEGW